MAAAHDRDRLTDAEREMVKQNLGLVGMQVKRLMNRAVPLARREEHREELFQEGCLALMRAARVYDSASGMSFATYALPRIHYAARRALDRYRETIRLPDRLGRTAPDRPDARPGERSVDRAAPGAHAKLPGSPGESRTNDPDRLPSRRTGAGDPFVRADSLAHSGRRARAPRGHGDSGRAVLRECPRVRLCSSEELNALPSRADPHARPARVAERRGRGDDPTIGSAIRLRLEAAVSEAVDRVRGAANARSDRRGLARRIADERLLIPEPTFQSSLRRIARETGSSYGRVLDCEARVRETVREILVRDVEFKVLRKAGADDPDGLAAPYDDTLRRAVSERTSEAIVGLYTDLAVPDQARLVVAVLLEARVDVELLLRRHVPMLGTDAGRRLLGRFRDESPGRRVSDRGGSAGDGS